MRQRNARHKTQRRKRGSRIKKGGKQMQEGSQGCAFSPALKCKGETTRDEGMISKIMLDNVAAEKEMKSAALVRGVDPDMKYSIYPSRMCDFDEELLDAAENNMERCRVMNRYTIGVDKAKILLIPEGGVDLQVLTLKPGQQVAFFESLLDLLKGAKLQYDNRFAHLDIKPKNIVTKFNRGKFQTKQIDFGLSVSRDIDPVKLGEHLSVSDYQFWPWELRILSDQFNFERDTSDAAWEEFKMTHIIEVKERFPQGLQLDPETHKIKSEIRTHLQNVARLYHERDETLKRNIRESILMKADMYGLGRTLQELQNAFTGHGLAWDRFRVNQIDFDRWRRDVSPEVAAYHERLQDELTMPFFDLCMNMMNPDVIKRFTPDEAITFWNEHIQPKIIPLFGDRQVLDRAIQPVLRWIETPIPNPKTPVFGEREREMFGHNNNFATGGRRNRTQRRKQRKTK